MVQTPHLAVLQLGWVQGAGGDGGWARGGGRDGGVLHDIL